jgi:hypothetical protein
MIEQSQPEQLRKEVEKSILAREKRALKQTAKVGLVTWNIDPEAIPLKTVHAEKLYEDIARSLGSSFDDSQIIKLIPPEVRNQVNPKVLLELALKNDQFIQFKGGLLRLEGIARVTPIDKMGAGSQQISAAVVGSTDEAMLLCKNLCLSLWRASGIEKRWEDIKPFIARIQYKSTTVSELPFPLADLLQPKFNDFMGQDVGGDNGFGKMMGLRHVNDETQRQRRGEILTVSHCRRIEMVVSTFNTVTGDAGDTELDFMIESRDDANRSHVYVTSELPIAEHVQLVETLVSRQQK